MEKVIERRGTKSEPYVRRYPQVIGGVCEHHGVINSEAKQFQYTLCPNDGVHPVWNQLHCSYCDATKDPNDVIYHSTINIYDSPTNPNELIVVCDNFTCVQKHQARFQR